jgi:hypothetical protein
MGFFKRPSAAEIRAIGIGAAGFTVASMAVFGSWAFGGRWLYRHLSELGAYAVWALMFILIAGATLHRLSAGHLSLARFYGIFAGAFLLYAIGWTAIWFLLRDRPGEWLASLVGSVLMGLVFAGAFSAWARIASIIGTLFLAHSLGYFSGGLLYETVGKQTGMLLWGLAYGLGFGAGIGRALFLCQSQPPAAQSLKRP